MQKTERQPMGDKSVVPVVTMIDDNEDDILFTRITFERCGTPVQFQSFTSAKVALDAIASGACAQSTLLLLDINMPGMSGFDFLEAYECLPPERRATLVVVMLTSSADERDKEKALGFPSVKAFVTKPVDRSTAASLLQMRG